MAGNWITVNKRRIPIDKNKSTGTCIRQYYKSKGKGNVSKKEAAEVTHAINTDCNIYKANSKYKIGGEYIKAYGNYSYRFVINDFDDYTFISKKKIK